MVSERGWGGEEGLKGISRTVGVGGRKSEGVEMGEGAEAERDQGLYVMHFFN